ncbi:MAG: acetate--CoA ligase family protein [Phycisphaerales bacterium]|nr:acetate--CoA ligase family protein [Phycisphaerales bacterium]
MARLHEFEGKAILSAGGIAVPRGFAARTREEARHAAERVGSGECVVKIQAWTTGRAAIGGIVFCASPAEAEVAAAKLLAMRVGQFPVTHVLVEEKLSFAAEIFLSISIDERERRPVLLLAAGGGSGIEERAASVHRVGCDVERGPDAARLADAVASLPVAESLRSPIAEFASKAFRIARTSEARSLEINPLAITRDGRLVAADCRITIDDYAVARHPELGITFARELDHPPTDLERLAYRIEQEDHRGTFFFAQMNTAAAPGSKGLIGFHGAGGGGSMMSMDAITNEGFTIANFCDTSGNPSPAKVYRAARIILAQAGLIGYFGSGSGVANQEQFWSAYGLAKAFWELDLDIPAVIRLGGNTEDRAVDILQGSGKAAGLRARVEGYRKTDPPARIAARFATLVAEAGGRSWAPRSPRYPGFVGKPASASFPVKGGRVWVDPSVWKTSARAIILRSNGLLRDNAGTPTPTLKPEEFMGKDSDMIACEVECRRDGVGGLFVELDMPAA